MNAIAKTPAAMWRAKGEPDPHADRYDCDRAALVMGEMTDDELANAVYVLGNVTRSVHELKAGAIPSIAYLTAAKDRIRWLSRALEDAKQGPMALAVAIADDSARSDIEIYAKGQAIPAEHGGYWIYSLTETVAVSDSPKVTLEDAIDCLRLTQRAAKYIRERGNAFAWRMADAKGYPGYVRFIEPEAT